MSTRATAGGSGWRDRGHVGAELIRPCKEASPNVLLWLSVLVTTTFTAPAACAPVVAVIVVLFTTVTLLAAVPPSVNVAPARNPVPLTVTPVPPTVVPDVGLIHLTVGAGFPPPPAIS